MEKHLQGACFIPVCFIYVDHLFQACGRFEEDSLATLHPWIPAVAISYHHSYAYTTPLISLWRQTQSYIFTQVLSCLQPNQDTKPLFLVVSQPMGCKCGLWHTAHKCSHTLAKVINDALGADLSNWDHFLLLFFFSFFFLALHTCPLISLSSLQLPFFSCAFIHAENSWASHSLTLVLLLNTFFNQSSTGFIWSLQKSSSSVSWPLKDLTKQTASSKWNLNFNSELWAFLFREIFHQAPVYTGRCPDTGKHHPDCMSMDECALTSTLVENDLNLWTKLVLQSHSQYFWARYPLPPGAVRIPDPVGDWPWQVTSLKL